MSSNSVHLRFDNTLGAVLIGFAVACILYGVLNTQIFTYFTRFDSDRPTYKLIVIIIWMLDTACLALIGHLVYFNTITNFAAPLVVLQGKVTWSFILQQTLGSIIGAIVKTCFAMRVWRFSDHNKLITAVILLLVVGHLGLSILFTIKAFHLPDVFAVSQLKILGTIALGVDVLTDVIIAAALCFFLRRLRTGFKRSDSIVNSLCRYAINTGALTSAVSISTLVLYNVMPQGNFIFVATYFILNKMYGISFMATLNTRKIVRGRVTDEQLPSTSHVSHRHSNTFFLGTRMPSVGSIADLESAKFSPEQSVRFSSFPTGKPSPI